MSEENPALRVYFKGHGHTYVPIKPSVTVKMALLKPMKLRKLIPEVCVAYAYCGIIKTPISWDSEISKLVNKEIIVEQTGYWPIKLSHNFIKRRHSSLSCTFVLKKAIIPCKCTRYGLDLKCMCCNRRMNAGFVCTNCNFTFHKRCANGVPILCQTAQVPSPVMSSIKLRSGERFGKYRASPAEYLSSTAYISLIEKQSDFDDIKTLVIDQMREQKRKGREPFEKNIKTDKAKVQKSSSIEENNRVRIDIYKSHTLKKLTRQKRLSGYSTNSFDTADYVSLETLCSSRNCIRSSKVKERQRAITEPSIKDEKLETPSQNSDPEEFEIPVNEIRIESNPVGSGSFGKVYKGYWCGPIAVKVLKDTYPSGHQIQAFKNEINLLKKTRHVNILLFMGCVSTSNNWIAIVTQWCDGSSLYHHIHVVESPFEMRDIIEITVQISQGMTYLHGKNIIHRDLKSSNVFLLDDKSLIVKIGDFGLATIKANCGDTKFIGHPEGSILWMAPEIITAKKSESVSFQSDVYAFGIVLYELFSKTLPYSDGGNKRNGQKYGTTQLEGTQIMWLVGSGQIIPNMDLMDTSSPPSIKTLIMNCIQYNAQDRVLFPHIITTLEHTIQNLPRTLRAISDPTININIS